MVRVEIAWAESPWHIPLIDTAGRLPWDPRLLGRELWAIHYVTPLATMQAMLAIGARRTGLMGPRLGVPLTSDKMTSDVLMELPGTGLISVAQAFLDRATHEELAEAATRVVTSEEACLNHIKWWGKRYPIGPFLPDHKQMMLRQSRLRTAAVLASYRSGPQSVKP